MSNSVVFDFRWNTGSDWIFLTEVGREFQTRDAADGGGSLVRRVSTAKQTEDGDVPPTRTKDFAALGYSGTV